MNAETKVQAGEPISDDEVVRRVVAGDTALFEIMMRRHNQQLYRAVRAVLRDDGDAEDVLQQAWLNAYRHLAQFGGAALFSTWLTRIAVNEALARLRKREPSAPNEESEAMLMLVDDRSDPEQAAGTTELRELLEREVTALPSSFRAVVVLRDVEGMSTAETASVLGISEDLVKTRLHRARSLLRNRLEQRAGLTLQSLFTFGNSRCDRVVANVMAAIQG